MRIATLVLACVLAPGPGDAGDVWLVAGDGRAVPGGVLSLEPAVVLTVDHAPLPAALAEVWKGERGASATTIPLDAGTRDTEATRLALEGARAIHLVGGDFLDWWQGLDPRGHASGALLALRRAHRGGATLVAHGGAARYLASAALVPRARLDRDRNPHPASADVVVAGLRLVPDLLVDLEDGRGGGLERTLHCQRVDGVDRALVLDGDVAWGWSARLGRARVAGPGSAVLIDLSGARREREGFADGHLALLRAGDGWEARGRRPSPIGEDVSPVEGTLTVDAGPRLETRTLARGLGEALRDGVPRGTTLTFGAVRLDLRRVAGSVVRRDPGGALRVARLVLGASGLPRDPPGVRR